ncbi:MULTISPECIES: hypothetical protein [Sphingomonas]|uniref:Uncharacterized protein n=1 Tax=Sphingomonas molluscorum TaxID=418184 RepID=A0ABU8Q337_9SPHN|nr:hypothetical protein [Sphingomonas sp. JUb134]MBM7405676.1 hypothetical protein [Sphingomonas sp. JUb134]
MDFLINSLSAVMATVAGALILANVLVVLATLLHQRRAAMRFLSHFSKVVSMLRLSDSFTQSRPYRHR